MQKYGFCFLNVMLLQIVRNAFRGQTWIFCGVFATLFQFVSSVVGRPLAAVGARFIVPSYLYISTKWGTEMCLR